MSWVANKRLALAFRIEKKQVLDSAISALRMMIADAGDAGGVGVDSSAVTA